MYKIERVYDYPKEMQRNKKVKQQTRLWDGTFTNLSFIYNFSYHGLVPAYTLLCSLSLLSDL